MRRGSRGRRRRGEGILSKRTLLLGGTIYHCSVLRLLSEWDDDKGEHNYELKIVRKTMITITVSLGDFR